MSRLREEAARWFLRLQDRPDDDSLRTRFEAWLLADPRHGHEYRQFDSLWHGLDRPDTLQQLARAAETRRQQRRQLLKGSAASLLLGVAGWRVWAWREAQPQWQTLLASQQAPLRQTLPDGSMLTVGAASRASVRYLAAMRHVQLDAGQALFDVQRDSARPFVVSTPLGQVTVLGTRFAVQLDGQQLHVAVASGRVQVGRHAGDNLAVLQAGDYLTLGPAGAERTPAPAVDPFLWAQGTLAFHNATLQQVAATLAPYRRKPLRVEGNASLRLTAVVQLRDLSAFLQRLPQVLPVVVTDTDSATVLRPRR